MFNNDILANLLEKQAASLRTASMDKEAMFGMPGPSSKPGGYSKYPQGVGGGRVTSPEETRAKFRNQAKETNNPYHLLSTTITSFPEVYEAYQKLQEKNVDPRAFKLVNKLLERWNVEGDKALPSGGLTSKEASESKEAGLFSQKNYNEFLINVIDDFYKRYDKKAVAPKISEAMDNLRVLVDTERNRLSPEQEASDNAINNFLVAFNKVFTRETEQTLPKQIKSEADNMLNQLKGMVKGKTVAQQGTQAQAPAAQAPAAQAPVAEAPTENLEEPTFKRRGIKIPEPTPVAQAPDVETPTENLEEPTYQRRNINIPEPTKTMSGFKEIGEDLPTSSSLSSKDYVPAQPEDIMGEYAQTEPPVSQAKPSTAPISAPTKKVTKKPVVKGKKKRPSPFVTTSTKQDVPAGTPVIKEGADKSNNILIFEGIEMDPSIVEIDASSDEIHKLEKVLFSNINF